MKANRAFFGGMFAALVITGLLALGRLLGVTELNFSMLWGTFATRPDMNAWFIGETLHLFFGGLIGLAYGIIFERLRRAGPLLGVGIGLAQFLVIGLLLGVLDVVHPGIGTAVEAPGFFAVAYGFDDVIMLALVHMVFGSLNGALYEQPLHSTTGAAEYEGA